MTQKFGFIALAGRPNAGKSTLLNALIGQKISIVSAKPQTTRKKIIGLITENDTQIAFIDTPGLHKTARMPKLNKLMNDSAWHEIKEADAILYLIDVSRGWLDEDEQYLEIILTTFGKTVALLVSKVDAHKKDFVKVKVEEIEGGWRTLLERLKDTTQAKVFNMEPIESSAKRPESLRDVRALVKDFALDGPWLYGIDDLTNENKQNIIAELVREQVFRQLSDELPYSAAVKIDKLDFEEKIVKILATIIVKSDSQKPIVIGKGGSRIKSIGTAARIALEKSLDKKVYLELFVKVQDNWMNDSNLISEFSGLTDVSES